MAMTKKEEARVAALLNKMRILGALRWTTPVKPDMPIPTWPTVTNGWLFSAHSGNVAHACSSSVNHEYGRWDSTTTQGPRELYSTPLLALQACRHAVELECAQKLARIDKAIETEIDRLAEAAQA